MKVLPYGLNLIPFERLIVSLRYDYILIKGVKEYCSITEYTSFGVYLLNNGFIIDVGYSNDENIPCCLVELND